MSRHWLARGASACALSTVFAGGLALAQPAAPAASPGEIVVTGSLIRGTPTDAALPVQVIGANEMEKQGAPSTLELLKALPISSGVLGDTNQFDARAQGSEGSGSVNLRGLGAQRTLVLINGRRMAINPFGQAGAGIVDTNMLPLAAVGRVEVLKDGGAVTYGSDAIAGVVNFITRDTFRGLEVAADYKYIDGTNGDYSLSGNYGRGDSDANLLLSIGYQHRSQLSVQDRSWAHQPYLSNPEGGWSAAGNPSTLLPLAASGAPAGVGRDAQCATLGGFPGFSGSTPICGFQYNLYDNLVEKEDHIQLYGQFNARMAGDHHFHFEVLYGHTAVPDWQTSPSYAALAVPTIEAAGSALYTGRYVVPSYNPGLIDYYTKNGGVVPANGVQIAAFRPFALGGNPEFGYGPSKGARTYDAFRVVSSLNGPLAPGVDYDVALTYSQETGVRTGYDTLVDRFELALRGFGGPNCNITAAIAANTPGQNGCQYFNPFSTAISKNAITGATNPQYNAAVANSVDLTKWLFPELRTKQTAQLFTAEAAISGKTGVTLPGGAVGWALGTEYRKTFLKTDYNDISNALVNPCVNTPDFGVVNCTGSTRNGPFMFLGVGTPVDLSNDVYAVFGELKVPITETLQAQLAARYEDYGGAVGSTFNPKVALRWQATDWLALRASYSSTFRGPPDTVLTTSPITSLQSILGTFRAVDIIGSPNLQPEKAKNYNVGAILRLGDFRATVDLWKFDFNNPINTDPVAGIVNAVFPNGATGANNCANPAYAALVARFTFTGACGVTTIGRLKTYWTNGAPVKTDGVDIDASYRLRGVLNGDVTLGGAFTYVNSYKIGDTSVEGIKVQPGFDAVGLLNYQTTAYPIPQWKGDLYAEWASGPHNLRLTMHYIDSYTDQRTAPFATGAYKDSSGNPVTVSAGKTIDAQVNWDLAYRMILPHDTTLTAAVLNLTDEDPAFARLDLNYDPFTGNALGRVIKVGIRKKF